MLLNSEMINLHTIQNTKHILVTQYSCIHDLIDLYGARTKLLFLKKQRSVLGPQ